MLTKNLLKSKYNLCSVITQLCCNQLSVYRDHMEIGHKSPQCHITYGSHWIVFCFIFILYTVLHDGNAVLFYIQYVLRTDNCIST